MKMSPEEAAKIMDYSEFYDKYYEELNIYWYELGCNYEWDNELDDWIEDFYSNNGGFDDLISINS